MGIFLLNLFHVCCFSSAVDCLFSALLLSSEKLSLEISFCFPYCLYSQRDQTRNQLVVLNAYANRCRTRAWGVEMKLISGILRMHRKTLSCRHRQTEVVSISMLSPTIFMTMMIMWIAMIILMLKIKVQTLCFFVWLFDNCSPFRGFCIHQLYLHSKLYSYDLDFDTVSIFAPCARILRAKDPFGAELCPLSSVCCDYFFLECYCLHVHGHVCIFVCVALIVL